MWWTNNNKTHTIRVCVCVFVEKKEEAKNAGNWNKKKENIL